MEFQVVFDLVLKVGVEAFLYALLVLFILELGKGFGLIQPDNWSRLSNVVLTALLTGPRLGNEESAVLFSMTALIASGLYRLWAYVLLPLLKKGWASRPAGSPPSPPKATNP